MKEDARRIATPSAEQQADRQQINVDNPRVLVLNAGFQPLGIASIRRVVGLVMSGLADVVEEWGYEAEVADTVKAGWSSISKLVPDVAIVDLKLPDGSGLDLLHRVKETYPDVSVIILTGHATVDSAVKALKVESISVAVPGTQTVTLSGVSLDVAAGTVSVSVDGGPERKAALRLISRREAELSLDGDTRAYSFAPVYRGTVTADWNDPQPGVPTELFLGNEGWSCRLEVLTRATRLARVLVKSLSALVTRARRARSGFLRRHLWFAFARTFAIRKRLLYCWFVSASGWPRASAAGTWR